jgi:quercetin dioxygenase-like cupin family protein
VSDTHAPRRTPAAPSAPLDLAAAATDLLEQAAAAASGRAARSLTPGAGAATTQTLVALTAGSGLREHDTPGPASIQVLTGDGRLTAGDEVLELTAGAWATIPARPHQLDAETDLVVLLTIGARPPTR